MWSIKTYDNYMICGTVDGELLLLDKTAFSIEKRLVLGKKNIGSLYIDGETIYVASHDGRLFKIDIKSFEIESLTKKCPQKNVSLCRGIWGYAGDSFLPLLGNHPLE